MWIQWSSLIHCCFFCLTGCHCKCTVKDNVNRLYNIETILNKVEKNGKCTKFKKCSIGLLCSCIPISYRLHGNIWFTLPPQIRLFSAMCDRSLSLSKQNLCFCVDSLWNVTAHSISLVIKGDRSVHSSEWPAALDLHQHSWSEGAFYMELYLYLSPDPMMGNLERASTSIIFCRIIIIIQRML